MTNTQLLNSHPSSILAEQEIDYGTLDNNTKNSNSDKVATTKQKNSHTQQFNFRALLRKTGQDLTGESGSTLSRKRVHSESQQVDFRNVLKNHTNPAIEKLK
jgi:hypothetical protein